ncbi:MAG: MauE/DoxX family redox-associated membrane protein [Ignavibacteriaceae bacterium]
MKEKTVLILKYLTGILFLVSGFSKLFPIEPFELIIVNQKIMGWELVPYFSRLLIGFELFLGFSLLQNSYVKKIFLPASFILLGIFNIQLIYSMLANTAGDNCGCFGEVISMTPMEALLKNIVLMGIILWVHRNYSQENFKLPVIIGYLVFSYFIVLYIAPIKPYVVHTEPEPEKKETRDAPATVPADDIAKDEIRENALRKPLIEKAKEKEKIKVDTVRTKSIFSRYTLFSDGKKVNLDSGIKLVALFSLDCDHCQETAKQLGQLKRVTKIPPVYILFFGEERQIKGFFDFAGTTFPYKIISPQEFFPMITAAPPRVCYLQNGKIMGDWNSSVNIVGELKKLLGRE